jgi:hypothetical protein
MKTPSVSFLKLDNGVPDLVLEPLNKNDLEIESKVAMVGSRSKPYVLSLSKEMKDLDLSKRPILNMLKGAKKRRHLE